MSFVKRMLERMLPKRRRVIDLHPTVEMRSVRYKRGMRIYSLSQCGSRSSPKVVAAREGRCHEYDD